MESLSNLAGVPVFNRPNVKPIFLRAGVIPKLASSPKRPPAVCSSPQSFLEHLNAVNDDDFVACLDVGHAEMKGLNTNSVEMIRALSDKLQALHLHDNDLWHDSHQIPFSMHMDFDGIVKALKEIGYRGDFTLEADAYLGCYNKDTIFEGIKNLANAAKKLRDLYFQ